MRCPCPAGWTRRWACTPCCWTGVSRSWARRWRARAVMAGTGPGKGRTRTCLLVGSGCGVTGALPERVTCHARLRPFAGRDRRRGGAGRGADRRPVALRGGRGAGGSGVGPGVEAGDASGLPVGRGTDGGPAVRAGMARGRGPARASASGFSAPAGDRGGVRLPALASTCKRKACRRPGSSALFRDLERLSRAYAVAALDRLGWRRERGAEVAAGELRRRLKVVSEHEAVLGRVLGLAADAGVLEQMAAGGEDGSSWRVVSGSGDGLTDAALADPAGLAAALAGRHGFASIELGLLSRCGEALADVLRGRADPLGLLFDPAGASAADLYRDAPAARAVSRLLASLVSAAVSGLPEERRSTGAGGGSGDRGDDGSGAAGAAGRAVRVPVHGRVRGVLRGPRGSVSGRRTRRWTTGCWTSSGIR